MADDLKKQQEDLHKKIDHYAEVLHLSNDKIEPIVDGVCDLVAICNQELE